MDTTTTEKLSPDTNTKDPLDTDQEVDQEEEDWDSKQFHDINFNDIHKANCIRREYSAHFLKDSNQEAPQKQVTFQEPEPKTIYYLPKPEYYNSNTEPQPSKRYQNPNIYLLNPPTLET